MYVINGIYVLCREQSLIFIFCKLTSETGPPKAGQRYIFRISRREILLEASAESQEVCSIAVMITLFCIVYV